MNATYMIIAVVLILVILGIVLLPMMARRK